MAKRPSSYSLSNNIKSIMKSIFFLFLPILVINKCIFKEAFFFLLKEMSVFFSLCSYSIHFISIICLSKNYYIAFNSIIFLGHSAAGPQRWSGSRRSEGVLLIDGCMRTQHEAGARLEAELQCNPAAACKGAERCLLKIALGGKCGI